MDNRCRALLGCPTAVAVNSGQSHGGLAPVRAAGSPQSQRQAALLACHLSFPVGHDAATVPLVATRRKPAERFQWSREASRVQVLGSNTFVRIADHEGRNYQLPARPGHLSGLLEAVYAEDPECALRIAAELEAAHIDPGWAAPAEDDLSD